jgi:hypothetical protein
MTIADQAAPQGFTRGLIVINQQNVSHVTAAVSGAPP